MSFGILVAIDSVHSFHRSVRVEKLHTISGTARICMSTLLLLVSWPIRLTISLRASLSGCLATLAGQQTSLSAQWVRPPNVCPADWSPPACPVTRGMGMGMGMWHVKWYRKGRRLVLCFTVACLPSYPWFSSPDPWSALGNL